MKIERAAFPGWNDHPVYRVWSFSDFTELSKWMDENSVNKFLLSAGGRNGYVFQIRDNHAWFALRWL